MTKRYLISVEPIEPSGVVLTIAELPGLVIFGQTAEDALGWAREAIAFQLRARQRPTAGARVCPWQGQLTRCLTLPHDDTWRRAAPCAHYLDF